MCILNLSNIFGLNVTLTLVFNFKVLLSYRAIHAFLVQKFCYHVATHGHATYSIYRLIKHKTCNKNRMQYQCEGYLLVITW
jgi:hypothetical protein